MYRLLLSLAALLLTAQPALAICTETSEGTICTVTQPLVGGTLVSRNDQRDFGLVTLGNGCSATVMNRYWVLTADHCVTTNGQLGGPSLTPSTMRITATWSGRTVTPTRLVRNWNAAGLDLALIFMGMGDFGTDRIQLLALDPPEDGANVLKFGRGISAFAIPAVGLFPSFPAVADGLYRSAVFTTSGASATTYTVKPPADASAPIPDGGDSGGSDVLLGPNGVGLGISGVQSTCVATGVAPPQPLTLPGGGINWTWVTGISSCNSAVISRDTRFDMLQIMREVPPPALGVLQELLTDAPDDLRRVKVDISGALFELR